MTDRSPTIRTCDASARTTAAARSRSFIVPRGPTGARSSSPRCCSALPGLLEAAGPIFGKRFIDHYLLPRNGDVAAIALLLAGCLASGCVASIIRYFQLVRLAGLSTRSVQRLRESVYAHALALPMSFFDRAITGQLVSRITNDTEAVKDLYVKVLFEILVGVTVLFGVLVAMLWLDWRLMLIVLLLVPATVGIVLGYQRLSARAVTRARELRSDINAQMAESIAGMGVLQAAGAARRFGERFARTNDAHYRARLGEVRANAWLLRPALDFVNVAADRRAGRGDRHAEPARAWRSACCTRSSRTSRASSSR